MTLPDQPIDIFNRDSDGKLPEATPIETPLKQREAPRFHTTPLPLIPDRHIILIGFKHVGKSVIGRILAHQLRKNYIDIDREIERLYAQQHQTPLTCREIVQQQGEQFFRQLEQEALQQAVQAEPCIISTGGGAPMRPENCRLMAPHCVVHITAKPKDVFDRIMKKGAPAFFTAAEDPWRVFWRLWKERERVYMDIATVSVRNNGSIGITVKWLLRKLIELQK